jgi:hypothetical protein
MPIATSETWWIIAGRAFAPLPAWISRAKRAIFAASSPMRSRSVTILLTAMMRRRSEAAGCRRTITVRRSSSSARSRSFTRASEAMAASMRSASPPR